MLFCQEIPLHLTSTQTAPPQLCWMSSDREMEQIKLLVTTSMTMFAFLPLTQSHKSTGICHVEMDNLLLLSSTLLLMDQTKARSDLAWEPLNLESLP